MQIGSILIVCTGNICRSPMAEYILKDRLRPKNIHVHSAGTGALVGEPAAPFTALIMQRQGFDLATHRARQINLKLLESADLILALDRGHKAWIGAKYPHLLGRVFKLGFWNGDSDVEDPYRKPLGAFEQAYTDIDRHVAAWVHRLSK